MIYNKFGRDNIPPGWNKYFRYLRYFITGILLVIFFWLTFFQVRPEEVGVITRFGKYIRKEEPGLQPRYLFWNGCTKLLLKDNRKRNSDFVLSVPE